MIINAAILEDNILFANQLKNLILIWADKNSHNFNIDVFHYTFLTFYFFLLCSRSFFGTFGS